jgi:tetratricopeptide (TPR) repeat protein
MSALILAQGATAGLFLDRLHLVAREPLTYAAFLVLVLAWTCRWYFARTQRYLEEFRKFSNKLPDKDKLSALQMLVLGFPESLSQQRLTVLRWRFMLAAYFATLLSLLMLGALLVHYWSMPAADVNERLRGIQSGIENLRGQMWQAQLNLQAKLDLEKERGRQFVTDVAVAAGRAGILSERNPEILSLAEGLQKLVDQFKTTIGPDGLSPEDRLQIRLAEATVANARGEYAQALSLMDDKDAESVRADTEAQIDREVQFLKVRGGAFYGLGRWQDGLACYERILQLRPTDWTSALWRANCRLFLSGAAAGHKEYDRLIEQLTTQVDQGHKEWSEHLAVSLSNRGSLLRDQGQFAAAMQDLSKAVDLCRGLIAQKKDVSEHLAAALTNRGLIFRDQDKLTEALTDLNEAVALEMNLAQEGKYALAERDLALVRTNRALILQSQGNLAAAQTDLDQVIQRLQPLVEKEGRAGLEDCLAWALNKRGGGVLPRQKQFAAAIEDLNRAVILYERLIEQKKRTDLTWELANTLHNRSMVFHAKSDLDAAANDAEHAVKLYERLVEKDKRAELTPNLAQTLADRGEICTDKGQLGEAMMALDKAVVLYTELVEQKKRTGLAPRLARTLLARSIALEKQGKKAEALRDQEKALQIVTSGKR